MPAAERALAGHVSPAAVSLRTPVLPTKPSRTISVLVGRAYSAAGQAPCCLHSMALIQAYQAELLAEVAEGTELTPAKSIGCSMVATERHLWLSHSRLQEKDKSFLLDAPLSPTTLFGGAIGAVADKLRAKRWQAEALDSFGVRAYWTKSSPRRPSSDQSGHERTSSERARSVP
ncbi:uncharacterized protein ACO6RY_11978 [Pungitius sinensis]